MRDRAALEIRTVAVSWRAAVASVPEQRAAADASALRLLEAIAERYAADARAAEWIRLVRDEIRAGASARASSGPFAERAAAPDR